MRLDARDGPGMGLVAPERVDDPCLGHHVVRVAGEDGKERALLWRPQGHGSAVARHVERSENAQAQLLRGDRMFTHEVHPSASGGLQSTEAGASASAVAEVSGPARNADENPRQGDGKDSTRSGRCAGPASTVAAQSVHGPGHGCPRDRTEGSAMSSITITRVAAAGIAVAALTATGPPASAHRTSDRPSAVSTLLDWQRIAIDIVYVDGRIVLPPVPSPAPAPGPVPVPVGTLFLGYTALAVDDAVESTGANARCRGCRHRVGRPRRPRVVPPEHADQAGRCVGGDALPRSRTPLRRPAGSARDSVRPRG